MEAPALSPTATDRHDPVRVGELDTADEQGWLLAGGVTLLVGARHAILVDPDGRRRTLVPDPGDPVRDRLRAVAARLGLSPSAGLTGFPAVPDDVAAGALWADVARSSWWTTRDRAGSEVDPALAAQLPELTGPPVEAEGDLAPLLATLRDTVPPAAAVAVVPCAVIRRVDLDEGRLRYRELWQDGTGPAILADERTGELVHDIHPVEPPFRPIARVAAGPVRVQVDGLHRSFVVRIDDAVFFVPGLPGATARGEEQLAWLAARAGLPPATVVVRHRRAVTEADLDPGAPADGVRVTRRTSVVHALLAATEGTPATAPLTDDPASPALRDAVTVDDDALRAAAGTLDDGLRPATFGACLAVDEEWTSEHASAAQSYLVAPGPPLADDLLGDRRLVLLGAPMLVTLADGSLAREHITVDSGGHLVDARRAAGCPVCERLHGGCCGVEVAACADCRRPACARCRAGAAEVTATRCVCCGDTSCAACSRHLPVATCTLCGRDACGSCTRDGRCATCRRLTPATADQIAHLPPELAAAGHLVLAGADATGVVVVLAGPHRRELALFDESGLQRWETAADDPLLPLRIAAARLTGGVLGGGEATFAALPAETVPPAPPDWLVLEYSVKNVLQWAVLADGGRRAGNFDPPGPGTEEPDDILLDELAEVLGAEPGPAPARPDVAAAIRGAVPPAEVPPPAGRVVTRLVDTEHLLAVGARGLVRRRCVGSSVDEEVAAWLLPSGPVPWAYAGWHPEPEVVALAELDGWSAVLARVGGFAMLALRQEDEEPVWHHVGGDRADLGAGTLGGLFAASALGVVTAASDGAGPTITGGMRVARDVTHHAAAGPAGDAVIDTAEALDRLGLAARPAAPDGDHDLPEGLAAHLRDHLESFPPRRIGVTLSARVTETWRLPDGDDLRIEYDLVPGRDGHVIDAVTGAPLRTANFCRAHHLVARVDVCAGCRTATCAACPDPVRPCRRCSQGVCGRCAGEGHCSDDWATRLRGHPFSPRFKLLSYQVPDGDPDRFGG